MVDILLTTAQAEQDNVTNTVLSIASPGVVSHGWLMFMSAKTFSRGE